MFSFPDAAADARLLGAAQSEIVAECYCFATYRPVTFQVRNILKLGKAILLWSQIDWFIAVSNYNNDFFLYFYDLIFGNVLDRHRHGRDFFYFFFCFLLCWKREASDSFSRRALTFRDLSFVNSKCCFNTSTHRFFHGCFRLSRLTWTETSRFGSTCENRPERGRRGRRLQACSFWVGRESEENLWIWKRA